MGGLKSSIFLFKLLYFQVNTDCILTYLEIWEKNKIVDTKDAFSPLFKNAQKWLVLQTSIFSAQDFPTNFIKQRYITLETPVKQNGTEIHCFLLVVRKMVQTKIFCPLLPPLETLTQIPLLFFLKLFLIPSPLYFKIPSNFFEDSYTFIIPISIAGQ